MIINLLLTSCLCHKKQTKGRLIANLDKELVCRNQDSKPISLAINMKNIGSEKILYMIHIP